MNPVTSIADQRLFDVYPKTAEKFREHQRLYNKAIVVLGALGVLFAALPAVPAIGFSIALVITLAAGTALTVATIAVPCILLGVVAVGGVLLVLAKHFINKREIASHLEYSDSQTRLLTIRLHLSTGCNVRRNDNQVEDTRISRNNLAAYEKMGMISKKTKKALKPFEKAHYKYRDDPWDQKNNQKMDRLLLRWPEIQQQVLDDLPSEAVIRELFLGRPD